MSTVRHLVGRFVGSLVPRRPSAADQAWVAESLTPAELNLWHRQHVRDQSHALRVARAAAGMVDDPRERELVVAAGLTHDVGKGVAGLGVAGRVGATLLESVVDDETARRWAWSTGWKQRFGAHLRYTDIGADLLAEGGSDPFVVAWAREHHLPPEQWSVPARLGEVLRAADDADV